MLFPSTAAFGLLLSEGMRVITVDEGTPAARSGLQPIDLVVACNGIRTSSNTIADQIRGKTAIELSIEPLLQPSTRFLMQALCARRRRPWKPL